MAKYKKHLDWATENRENNALAESFCKSARMYQAKADNCILGILQGQAEDIEKIESFKEYKCRSDELCDIEFEDEKVELHFSHTYNENRYGRVVRLGIEEFKAMNECIVRDEIKQLKSQIRDRVMSVGELWQEDSEVLDDALAALRDIADWTKNK
jgi:hypothetical protein